MIGRLFELKRCAVHAGLAAALLSGCAARSLPTATNQPNDAPAKLPHAKTFLYTGKIQNFKVPSGVTQLSVDARGGEGAGFNVYPTGDQRGFPGRVRAVIPVHDGDTLYVFVGGSGKAGGFNGGGAGYYGGGGASDVRAGGSALSNRIIVAAGGGGAGQAINEYGASAGGNGGGLTGKPGGGANGDQNGAGGDGGTQSAGGTGGIGGIYYTFGSYSHRGQPGADGALGTGGAGGSATGCNNNGSGGGGGGGYYGGGGGGAGVIVYTYGCLESGQGGGGGGGSSYVESTAIKSQMWTGWKSKGDGLIVFSWN